MAKNSKPWDVQVGDIVLYFANPNDQTPKAALVVTVFSPEMVCLQVSEGSGWTYRQSVNNKNSDAVKNNLKLAINFGMWDHKEPEVMRRALYELVYGPYVEPEPEKVPAAVEDEPSEKSVKTDKKQLAKV